ncbi:hypothetical protein ALC62_09543 [Cyphomyrmex costatus]|uniref:Uncharacterized protein n=1 Tax=Cyphomyrmex costatus TaxID=456900 RepID=A0A195CGU6_9HYME|nr:hypothetical protein ALC62_09543 [Cyphomyrmex costatus]
MPSIVSPVKQKVPLRCRPLRPITEQRLACTKAFCDRVAAVRAGCFYSTTKPLNKLYMPECNGERRLVVDQRFRDRVNDPTATAATSIGKHLTESTAVVRTSRVSRIYPRYNLRKVSLDIFILRLMKLLTDHTLLVSYYVCFSNDKAETRIDVVGYFAGVYETPEQSCWDTTDLIKNTMKFHEHSSVVRIRKHAIHGRAIYERRGYVQLVGSRPFQELQAVFPGFYDSAYEREVNNDNGRRFAPK